MTLHSEKKSKVIAIDGPSGSGKSTVAKKIAERLNILYVDTGAMFRALAFYFDKDKMAVEDCHSNPDQTKQFLNKLKFEYAPPDTFGKVLVRINNQDLTQTIREHHVSTLASRYSQVPVIRDFLLKFQRDLAMERFCVMEGRDIGTVVFPDSFCKIFLIADLNTRAQRRLLELTAKGEKNLDLSQVCHDLEKRDLADSNRTHAPLVQASDAFLLDSSGLNQEQVLDKIVLQVNSSLKKWGMSIP